MSESMSYYQSVYRDRTVRLRELSKALPSSCIDFFRALEPTTSILTRLNYAYDLRLFFDFLMTRCQRYEHLTINDWSDQMLAQIDYSTLEQFLDYLNIYTSEDGRTYANGNNGKARKVSALKSFFKYLYRTERISANPADKLLMPKIHEKEIIRLEPDEVAKMLDEVDSGQALTETQKRYHDLTRLRDIAIFTLLLGTGIRISELVGLDIEHIDFSADSFLITRKGGSRVILYFGEEVENALLSYLEERKNIEALPGHEHACFLSLQRRRMSQRAIQLLVKKYAKIVVPLKKISPHKFRTTYGTLLNEETGDIYLVADVLGNKDVNTTRRHYAALSEDHRKRAAGKVKLRND